jgi:hypothetical protein
MIADRLLVAHVDAASPDALDLAAEAAALGYTTLRLAGAFAWTFQNSYED